jgi:hypothetical protein
VVFTVNVAVVAPAGTVTLAATVADPLSLDSVTVAPPAGAGPLRVTVPVELLLPITVVGFRATAAIEGGLIVSEAACVPLYFSVIVAVAAVVTGVVFTVNVPVVAPAATVTLVATVAAALSLDRVTTDPPVGAGPFNVTVPAEVLLPMTLFGVKATDATAGALIVNGAD